MHTFTAPDQQSRNWPFETVTPREVQLRALSKSYGAAGFAYFMRQRLGKTWTSYAEFCLLRDEGKVKWCFIVCPNSLKQQWVDSILQVDPFTPIQVYSSASKKQTYKFFSHNKHGGVFIINYESVRSFVLDNVVMPVDMSTVYIVADESTRIKEPSNRATKACITLADQCAYKRILTGRPTANTNLDIWAQLRFIGGTTRNFFQHKYTFCVMGGFQGRQVVKDINVEQLQKEIHPVSYIAEDKYVQGFEKIYEPLRRVNLTGRLADLYKKMQNELVFALDGGVDISAPIVLTQYLRLQQISAGVAGDSEGRQHNLIEPHLNPRIQAVKDILENDIDHKVIIVCRFKLSIENLYEQLTHSGYVVRKLTGGMKDSDIEQVKRDFNEGPATVLVAQEQVLSFGHTLCATDDNPCDSMIFYEMSFSLINRAQCESRPEKMGRNKPISYYDLYASKMDKYIIQSLLKKEDASLALMNYSRDYGMRPKGLDTDD